MEFAVIEDVKPNLNYAHDEDPIAKRTREGWTLMQLVPEYQFVEASPTSALMGNKAAVELRVLRYQAIFRR